MLSGTGWDCWDCPVQGHELDWMIPVDPFQVSRFRDSMIRCRFWVPLIYGVTFGAPLGIFCHGCCGHSGTAAGSLEFHPSPHFAEQECLGLCFQVLQTP